MYFGGLTELNITLRAHVLFLVSSDGGSSCGQFYKRIDKIQSVRMASCRLAAEGFTPVKRHFWSFQSTTVGISQSWVLRLYSKLVSMNRICLAAFSPFSVVDQLIWELDLDGWYTMSVHFHRFIVWHIMPSFHCMMLWFSVTFQMWISLFWSVDLQLVLLNGW